MALKKSVSKEVNWFFHWNGGGYNSVMAASRSEALAKATELGRPKFAGHVTLTPLVDSLKRDADYKLTWACDKSYRGMFD